MSVLLREVLEIPERAGDEDYVLRLTDSVDDTAVAATLEQYVVTPALVEAFDTALGLVADALRTGISRGAFLYGSFGSGKSHFMAVLYALLRHNPAARAKAELQQVIARHDDVLLDKKVLPLAFHLLGAKSMEQAIFDGYLRQIEERHPGAPLPALHLSDGILADAAAMRARDGDERFFAALNGGANAGADPWAGLLGSGQWTPQTYEAARAAAPGTKDRQLLVTALVERFFGSYTRQASFVDLDTGLAAIAQHAKLLGYDGVALFLDELVLWLTFAVRDQEFFRTEVQKLTKLVEAGAGSRAIPLISFVSRQMDLRRWFAESGASGAEQEALDTAFRHQESRFGKIVLGDDNLPFVASKRLLRRNPANPQAEVELTGAFARLERRPEIWDVLLDGVNTDEEHRGADEKAFRLTYPFSPALISALRHLASAMQRERTALKVMQQMLVDRRETLTVDDVIPVGDAFDYIVSGKDALDTQTAALFRSASALYTDKLRPEILAKYGLTEAALADGAPVPDGLRADDRLAKTLLLAAVAPGVPALKEITASRLASLNHGSIRTLLPGGEASTVLAQVREWSKKIPEIHVGNEVPNPVIRVQLTDVDYETVVEKVNGEDNEGRRRELIRGLVRQALGISDRDTDLAGVVSHPVIWRGSRREVDIVFGNVRDATWLSEDHFRARPGTWRFVIDFPFDQPGHSGDEDHARLDRLIESGLESHTVAWLPRFLPPDRMAEVRRLVILDWLLSGTGERWTSNSDHLSEVERVQAKAILETQRTALREGLRRALQYSYGAAAAPGGFGSAGATAGGGAEGRILVSLDRGFRPAAPVGADLGAAFGNLVDQAFSATYPSHPRFEPGDAEVTVRELSAVYAHVERAVTDPDGRVKLEGDISAVRRVANSLGVGKAGETHFLFGDDRFTPWAAEFERAATRAGLQPQDAVTAGRVRQWIGAMEPPYGLRDEVADLIVLAWAALRQRAWYHYGSPIVPPGPGKVRPEMELRPEPLPVPADWELAAARAEKIFGIRANPYLTAASVAALAGQLTERAAAAADSAYHLVSQLEAAYQHLRISPDEPAGRLRTARACVSLVDGIRRAPDRVSVITSLARAALPATEAVVASSLSQAGGVADAIKSFPWGRLGPLMTAAQRDDDRGRTAGHILAGVRKAVQADEFAARLPAALAGTDQAIFDWLADGQPKPPPDDVLRPGPVKPGGREQAGRAVVLPGGDPEEVVARVRAFLGSNGDREVTVEWRVTG